MKSRVIVMEAKTVLIDDDKPLQVFTINIYVILLFFWYEINCNLNKIQIFKIENVFFMKDSWLRVIFKARNVWPAALAKLNTENGVKLPK